MNRHRKWGQHAAPLLLFAILTLALTWPLITRLDSSVLGPPQDNYYYLSWFAWLRHTIVDLGAPSTFDAQVFHPYGHDYNTSETTWANVLLTLPILLGFGEVAAHNVAVLASFLLSALGMYVLVGDMTGSRAAATISGIIYAFSPYRMAHLGGGQLPLLGTQWLPLCLWSIERALRARRWSWGLAAGLFYGLTALSSWYYAFMAALLLPVYVLARARPWRVFVRERHVWAAMVGFVVVAGLMVGPAIWPTLRLSGQASMSYSLQWVDRWSASVADYVLPNVMSTLWGGWASRFYEGQSYFYERVLYLGLAPLALAALGLWARKRARGAMEGPGPLPEGSWSPTVRALLWMGGVAFILSLGTTLHWRGVDPVHIPVPGRVDEVFTRGLFNLITRFSLNPSAYHWGYEQPGHIVLPLPAMLLYLDLPFSNAMRVWSRYGLFVMLVVSVLAGGGVAALMDRLAGKGRRLALGLCLSLAILIEFAAVPFPFGISQVQAQPATAWLRDQPGDSAVMELPLSRAMNGPPMYAAGLHGKPIAYGYGTFFPSEWLARRPALERFPDGDALQVLREWDVRYVLLGSLNYGQAWPGILARLTERDDVRLAGIFREEELYQDDRWFLSTRGTALPFVADVVYVFEILAPTP